MGPFQQPNGPHTGRFWWQTREDTAIRWRSKKYRSTMGGSAVSVASLGLNTSSRLLPAIVKMNGIVMGNLGTKIPREVKELVNKYICKQRSSPRLGGGDEKLRIIEQTGKNWDKAESIVSDIKKTLLFYLDASCIAEGCNALWSTKPLPCEYRLSICAACTQK